MTVYDFHARTIDGRDISLAGFSGKVLLIVNVASKCGFTPQYRGLQELYSRHETRSFEVLGFPCNQFRNQEPGSDADIRNFCDINYGVRFPMFSRIDVNGPAAHPLYQFLKKSKPGVLGVRSIKWNFTKFLIDRQGHPVKRYAPQTTPAAIEKDILAACEVEA